MGDKPWHLVGEVQGSSRPLNSALEIDMDYDTTNKPPPAPTEEATHSLEDMIRKRIADQRCGAGFAKCGSSCSGAVQHCCEAAVSSARLRLLCTHTVHDTSQQCCTLSYIHPW
jgi:hypothetical protein